MRNIRRRASRTDIRNNILGGGSPKSRVMESRGAQRRDVRPEGQRHFYLCGAPGFIEACFRPDATQLAAGAKMDHKEMNRSYSSVTSFPG
jgi:hypothetical protein